MPGKIKKMIDVIITQRSRGNRVLRETTRVKLILKGINPDHYTLESEDDPAILEKIENLAKELDVVLTHIDN